MGISPNDPSIRKMQAEGRLIDQQTGRPVGETAPARSAAGGSAFVKSVLSGVLHRVCVTVPPSTNNLFVTAGRRRVKSGEYRDWLATVLPEVAKLKRPDRYPVRIVATLFGSPPAVNMRRDIANLEKATTDAIVAAGVIPDDSLEFVTETVQRFVRSADGPGVWLEVQPV